MAIAKQFSWILVGRLSGALLQAASIALLARWTGPQQFGLFATAYGVAILVQSVADLGFSSYIVRQRALDPLSGRIRGVLTVAGRVNTLLAGVLGAASIVATSLDRSYFWLVPLALWVALDRQAELWLSIPLADGETWQNATSLIFRRTIAMGLLLLATLDNTDPLTLYTTGLALGSGIAAVATFRRNVNVLAPTVRVSLRYAIRESKLYYSNSVANQLRNLDTLLVSLLLTPAAAGLYAAASRLTSPLRIIPTSFATVLMPAVTKRARGGPTPIRKQLIVILSVTTAMYAILAVLLPALVPMLLGPSYDGARTIIAVVCIGLIFASLASQINSILQGTGALGVVSKISWASTLYCLVSMVPLGLWQGVTGAGIALSSSFVVQVTAQLIYLRRGGRLSL